MKASRISTRILFMPGSPDITGNRVCLRPGTRGTRVHPEHGYSRARVQSRRTQEQPTRTQTYTSCFLFLPTPAVLKDVFYFNLVSPPPRGPGEGPGSNAQHKKCYMFSFYLGRTSQMEQRARSQTQTKNEGNTRKATEAQEHLVGPSTSCHRGATLC